MKTKMKKTVGWGITALQMAILLLIVISAIELHETSNKTSLTGLTTHTSSVCSRPSATALSNLDYVYIPLRCQAANSEYNQYGRKKTAEERRSDEQACETCKRICKPLSEAAVTQWKNIGPKCSIIKEKKGDGATCASAGASYVHEIEEMVSRSRDHATKLSEYWVDCDQRCPTTSGELERYVESVLRCADFASCSVKTKSDVSLPTRNLLTNYELIR